MSRRLVGLALFASGVAVGMGAHATSDGRNTPAPVVCQEDEVAAVRVDPDPNHGLAWDCVNAEESVAEYAQQETGQ